MRRNSLVLVILAALTPLFFISPSAVGAPGDLAFSPDTPLVGEKLTFTGTLPDAKKRAIQLQKQSGSKWSKVTSGSTLADGSYSITGSTTAATSTFRVFAKKTSPLVERISNAVTVNSITPTAKLTIAKDAGSTATASGVIEPAHLGHPVALQYKSGSSWKALGSKVNQSATGKVEFSIDLSGLSKFTPREYRLTVDGTNGSPAFSSPSVPFAPGPTELGDHVLRITTDNGGTPTVKGVDYTGNVSIDGGAAIKLETVAVRGNSSATKAKKPYKLKFDKKPKAPVLGMPADKSFVLLPGFEDRSLVRNKMALDLAGKMSNLAWTPRSVFVEVFMNGQYGGSYQMTESIKIAADRANISPTDGIIVEIDPHFDADGVPGFFASKSKLPYTFKDPDEFKALKPADGGGVDPEGITKDKVDRLKARVTEFEAALYGSNFKSPTQGYAKYLDVDAAVDLYLVKEFIKEHDSDFYRSTYFMWDDYTSPDSKFVLGPEWDADRSAGNKPLKKKEFTNLPTGWFLRGPQTNHASGKTGWYVQMTKDPAFLAKVKARWLDVRGKFAEVATNDVDQARADIGAAAIQNERDRWLSASGRAYPAKGKTYQDEINYLKKWYTDRYTWMDKELTK